MRKLMVLVMVILALGALAGAAAAEHGGTIPPMITSSWGGR